MTPISSMPPDPTLFVPRWVSLGLNEIGIVEDTRPNKSTKRIEEYHAVTRAGSSPDDVPWCSSYCCWVFEACGIVSPKSKAASSWLKWGYAVPPRMGAVVVFGKTDPDAKGTGHVGIALGISGRDVYVLGGNQQNKVSIVTRDVRSVVAWRWPTAVEVPVLA